MTHPTDTQRLAFANGLAWLLLRHVKDLTPKDRKLIEAVRDAKTVDEMRAAYAHDAYTAYAFASYASVSYASVSYASVSYAQNYAVKAGVPEHEVAALRMTIFGE